MKLEYKINSRAIGEIFLIVLHDNANIVKLT